MGQASSHFTQYDMEELMQTAGGVFTQVEVESLYRRFRALDRGRKGYISGDEFINIPELSLNPIAQRMVRLFESVNFKEFIRLLAPFSPRATPDVKLAAMFAVYDVDQDGLIGREDMGVMLRQLAGSTLSDDDVQLLITRAMEEAGAEAVAKGGIDLPTFKAVLRGIDLSNMVVEVPVEW